MAGMFSILGADRQHKTSKCPRQKKSVRDSLPIQKTGLVLKTDAVFKGYTLFSPITSTQSFLMDRGGRVVDAGENDYEPGQAVYLLEHGRPLRTAFAGPEANHTFHGGGAGDRINFSYGSWDRPDVWVWGPDFWPALP